MDYIPVWRAEPESESHFFFRGWGSVFNRSYRFFWGFHPQPVSAQVRNAVAPLLCYVVRHSFTCIHSRLTIPSPPLFPVLIVSSKTPNKREEFASLLYIACLNFVHPAVTC